MYRPISSMPDQLGRIFRMGLLKAAETTGAWIITSGEWLYAYHSLVLSILVSK